MEDQVPVRSVVRAADILVALELGPQSLGRVARRTGLTKPTAHRLLASLAYRQMVIQDPTSGEYQLGPGCFWVADAVMRGFAGLSVLAAPVMEDLSLVTGETVSLHVRAGMERVCIGQVASPQPVRYTARVGAANPIHTGAMGKVLLAFTDDNERRGLLERLPLQASTAATITDRARLETEMEITRRRGYAVSRGERLPGVAAMSVPILGADGRLVAALSIIGPEGRLSDEVMATQLPRLREAAMAISGRIAGQERVSEAVEEPA